jgi:hypothetical protein
LITSLISEKMKIISTSPNGGSQESVFYSNTNRSRGRGGNTSFQGWHKLTWWTSSTWKLTSWRWMKKL